MNTYYVELDGVNDCGSGYYYFNNYKSLINAVEADLQRMGGGHADIYDEDGEFIDDVEI